jgi:hypothetical protein
MWLVTTHGFFSIVQNLYSTGADDALLVRGRVRTDLERFADFASRRRARTAVVASPDADYGFRLTTSREVLASFVAERLAALDYPNFKDEVANVDPKRAHVYMGVWTALHKLRGIRA